MPRGVYDRTKAKKRGRGRNRGDGLQGLLGQLRAERSRHEDAIVAIGTAIDALEAYQADRDLPTAVRS